MEHPWQRVTTFIVRVGGLSLAWCTQAHYLQELGRWIARNIQQSGMHGARTW